MPADLPEEEIYLKEEKKPRPKIQQTRLDWHIAGAKKAPFSPGALTLTSLSCTFEQSPRH